MTHSIEWNYVGFDPEFDDATRALRDRPHDLCSALEAAVADAFDTLGLTVRLDYSGPVHHAASIVAIIDDVVRVTLDNVARHARTSWASVNVNIDDAIWVRVRDHGCGFQLHPRVPAPGDATSLKSLDRSTRRIADVGGTMIVMSSPGDGTIVRLRMPIEAR